MVRYVDRYIVKQIYFERGSEKPQKRNRIQVEMNKKIKYRQKIFEQIINIQIYTQIFRKIEDRSMINKLIYLQIDLQNDEVGNERYIDRQAERKIHSREIER